MLCLKDFQDSQNPYRYFKFFFQKIQTLYINTLRKLKLLQLHCTH
jgi:hypothetical protein